MHTHKRQYFQTFFFENYNFTIKNESTLIFDESRRAGAFCNENQSGLPTSFSFEIIRFAIEVETVMIMFTNGMYPFICPDNADKKEIVLTLWMHVLFVLLPNSNNRNSYSTWCRSIVIYTFWMQKINAMNKMFNRKFCFFLLASNIHFVLLLVPRHQYNMADVWFCGGIPCHSIHMVYWIWIFSRLSEQI